MTTSVRLRRNCQKMEEIFFFVVNKKVPFVFITTFF